MCAGTRWTSYLISSPHFIYFCVCFHMNLRGNLIYRAWDEWERERREKWQQKMKERLGKNLRVAINNLSCLKYIQDSFKNGNFIQISLRFIWETRRLWSFQHFFHFKKKNGRKCENNLLSTSIVLSTEFSLTIINVYLMT